MFHKKFSDLVISSWVRIWTNLGAFAIIVPCMACEPSSICQCPPAEKPAPCPANHQIQLSQLDAVSRARLKNELQSEIKDELRAQWKREFEGEYKNSSAAQELRPKAEPKPEKRQAIKHAEDTEKPLPPTQKIERDAQGLKILRVETSTGVVRRQPIDARNMFSIDDACVFCFVEISAPRDEERMITLRFTHSTGLSQSFTLPVNQSPAWRTWSKMNLTRSMTGDWLCEIFNEDETLLASEPFTVVD